MRFSVISSASLAALALLSTPTPALACACGCGIFDIGDGTTMPSMSDSGFTLWARYAAMAQNRLQEQGHTADPADNGDKRIATQFTTLGGEYAFNRQWAVMTELPLVHRAFTTTDDGTWADPAGTINTRRLTALGDMKLSVTYSGFAPDMSTGVSLGVKLPTGRWHSPVGPLGGTGFDRDTMIGSGSTDLVVGAYHTGALPAGFGWYGQANYQFALASQGDYRPGNEFDAAIGISHPLAAGTLTVTPSLSLLGSVRARDSGANSDPANSGYARLLIAPGVRVALTRKLSIYGDVEVPLAQYMRAGDPAAGDAGQLVAPVLFKLQVNYGF